MPNETIKQRSFMMYDMIWNNLRGADLSIANITVTAPLKANTCTSSCDNGPEGLVGLISPFY